MVGRWTTDGEGRRSGQVETWTRDCLVHGDRRRSGGFVRFRHWSRVPPITSVNVAVESEMTGFGARVPDCRREQGFIGRLMQATASCEGDGGAM